MLTRLHCQEKIFYASFFSLKGVTQGYQFRGSFSGGFLLDIGNTRWQ